MNQAVQQVLESSVIAAARQVEEQLDAQLQQLENLDEDDLERIRQRRLDEMKRLQQKKSDWLAAGHGEYQEVEEKEFFAEAKREERLVCHFYRSSRPCEAMHAVLRKLAAAHLETKFVKLQAEKAPFLTDRLKIWMLPTLAIVKSGKTTDYVVGLDELGGKEDFPLEALAARLAAAGAIFEEGAGGPGPRPAAAEPQHRSVRPGLHQQRTASDEDSDFE